MKISAKLQRGPVSRKKYKQNSVNNVGGVKVLVLCILSDDTLYLYILFIVLKLWSGHNFHIKNYKGAYFCQ